MRLEILSKAFRKFSLCLLRAPFGRRRTRLTLAGWEFRSVMGLRAGVCPLLQAARLPSSGFRRGSPRFSRGASTFSHDFLAVVWVSLPRQGHGTDFRLKR